jgi:hypothetical protein
MIMSRYQNARLNHNLMIAVKSFEDVEKFKYSRMIVTNQVCSHESILKQVKFE